MAEFPEYNSHPLQTDRESLIWSARDSCLENRRNPNPEKLEFEEGTSYYDGQLIRRPRGRWTREEKLWLLDNHPMFTGRCPACDYQWARDDYPTVEWQCPACGAGDDGSGSSNLYKRFSCMRRARERIDKAFPKIYPNS